MAFTAVCGSQRLSSFQLDFWPSLWGGALRSVRAARIHTLLSLSSVSAIVLPLVISLASCSATPETQNDASNNVAAGPALSPDAPQPLEFVVVARPIANGVHIEGRTNLPDGTEIMLDVRRPPITGGDKAIVLNGQFASDILPKDGKPIPNGSYEVEVSTPFADVQPESVKSQVGPDYRALTGPLLVKSEFGGRIVDYSAKVHIGGAVGPKADQAARKAAYHWHENFAERSCRSNPDSVERLTGTQMTDAQRTRSVASCLAVMARSRRQLVREGVIEP